MINAEANMMLMIKVFKREVLAKKNKKQKLAEDSESDFKINFENVEMNHIKHKMLTLLTKISRMKLSSMFYYFNLS